MDEMERYKELRRRAIERGDRNLAAEITLAMQRLGWQETVVRETPMEQAVPVKRGPGRPRKYPIPE